MHRLMLFGITTLGLGKWDGMIYLLGLKRGVSVWIRVRHGGIVPGEG